MPRSAHEAVEVHAAGAFSGLQSAEASPQEMHVWAWGGGESGGNNASRCSGAVNRLLMATIRPATQPGCRPAFCHRRTAHCSTGTHIGEVRAAGCLLAAPTVS